MISDKQKYHFISGLPRSGSTMLAAILRQNPRFEAGMTSPVGGFVQAILAQVSSGSEHGAMIDKPQRHAILRGLFDSYYAACEAPVVFDTNRMWCAKLPLVQELFPGAKIIACVRNVAWIMDSIERLYRANPFENTRLFGMNMARSTVFSRLDGLAQHDHLVGFAWSALREAFYSEQASSMLVLDYELLAQAPQRVLPLIYDFLGEPRFEHDFDNVEYSAYDFDLQLGTPGLHTVRPKIEFIPRRTVMPPDLFEKYAAMTFWTDPAGSGAHIIAPKTTPLGVKHD